MVFFFFVDLGVKANSVGPVLRRCLAGFFWFDTRASKDKDAWSASLFVTSTESNGTSKESAEQMPVFLVDQ